jgi:hypothetical protein
VNSIPFVGICLLRIERGSYIESPYNEGVGSLSCAVRCLLSSSMESQDIISLNETGGLIMATHTLEAVFSHYTDTAATLQEQNVGNNDVAQASAVMPATTISPGRRCEARIEYRSMCSYEVLEAIDDESVVIEQGEAVALNRSTEGMLLLMGQAPHAKQLIEVHTPRSGWGRTVNVFEARWTRPVEVESLGNLYLVGCRRIFGPCHYLSF